MDTMENKNPNDDDDDKIPNSNKKHVECMHDPYNKIKYVNSCTAAQYEQTHTTISSRITEWDDSSLTTINHGD